MSTLQPIPAHAHPNISHNINATVVPASSAAASSSAQTTPVPVSAHIQKPHVWGMSFNIAVALLVAIVLGLFAKRYLFSLPED